MGSRLIWAVVFAGVALVTAAVVVGAESDSFNDDGGVHEPSVNSLAVAGVLEGTECGDRLICPDDPLLRWVMAVWITRALGQAPEILDATTRFADVHPDAWWVSYVERLADLGVTQGCKTDPLPTYLPGQACDTGADGHLFGSGFRTGSRPVGWFRRYGGQHACGQHRCFGSGWGDCWM